MQATATRPAPDQDDPRLWLGPSPLIDLEDPKLRLRVRSLTQLCKSDREKALALYGFVKRIPLARRFKIRAATAREVYEAGRGDAPDKATLLVAMLRIAGLPARIRYVRLRGEILRGVTSRAPLAGRALVEVWLQERWLRTDTYIYDAACMAAARQRLKDLGWEWGYGIHVNGAMIWDGFTDAFVGGAPTGSDPMVIGEVGVFHDPSGYLTSRSFGRFSARFARLLHSNILAPVIDRAWRQLRQEYGPADSRRRKST